jgi:hypothetical protein
LFIAGRRRRPRWGSRGTGRWSAPGTARTSCTLIDELQLLVQLYQAMGEKDKADTWLKQLQEAKDAAKKSVKP